jgi:hypothetical protein
MKIASFWRERKIRLGLLLGDEILEPEFADLLQPAEKLSSAIPSRLFEGENRRSARLADWRLFVQLTHCMDWMRSNSRRQFFLPPFFARAATTASIMMKRSAHRQVAKSPNFSSRLPIALSDPVKRSNMMKNLRASSTARQNSEL